MKKKKKHRRNRKNRAAKWLVAILMIALIAVAAVIVWRQHEYAASADFYDGLRGAIRGGMLL